MSLKQELFDRISKHLLNQNKRSTDHRGDCRYRGDNGLKCAVGAIISDKKYSEKLEGKAVTGLSVINSLPKRYQGGDSVKFLNQLQGIHDHTPVHLWREGLKKIAAKHNLVVNF